MSEKTKNTEGVYCAFLRSWYLDFPQKKRQLESRIVAFKK
jgi:hypothetical protein